MRTKKKGKVRHAVYTPEGTFLRKFHPSKGGKGLTTQRKPEK